MILNISSAAARLHSRTAAAVLLASALAAAPLASRTAPEELERRLGVMGTSLDVRVAGLPRPELLRASEAAVRALEEVAARLSTWTDDSELARLNAAAPDVRVPLSPELAADLRVARDGWLWSGGAFDPSVGALVEAWDLRGDGRVPDDEELAAARPRGGLAALELGTDASGPFAVRRDAGLVLEEGGFGKGVGLDAAIHALRDAGVPAAVLDLGGQVALFGEELTYGIAHPADRERAVATVRLSSGSLATSGNSERGVVVDGERFGHLLDPRSGRPAPDFGSVTVVAPTATAADLLSTAFYVLGPDEALERAARTDGVELLVLDTRTDRLRAIATPGLEGRLAVANGVDLELTWHRTSLPSEDPSPRR